MTEYEQVPGKTPGIMWPKDPGERLVRLNLSARPVCPNCGVPLSGSIDRTPDGGRMIECLNPQCLSTWDWDEVAQRPVAHKRDAALTGWQCPEHNEH